MNNLVPSSWRRSGVALRRAEDQPLFALQREMNRVFDNFFSDFDLMPFGEGIKFGAFTPSVDIKEDEKEVIIKAEVPGLAEKDVEVTFAEGVLTIRGEKKEEKEDKKQDYLRREVSYGAFHREIPLPDGINPEKVDAHFKNGVLTVTIPWLEGAKKKAKKISVKAG